MKSTKTLLLGAALLASVGMTSMAAMAKDIVVGVSWSNFQEERWKTDEAAIKAGLGSNAKYISADAQASPTKQLADVVFVAHDLTPVTRRGLLRGAIDAVIVQDPGSEARSALRVLLSLARGEPIVAEQEKIRVEIVMRDNMP